MDIYDEVLTDLAWEDFDISTEYYKYIFNKDTNNVNSYNDQVKEIILKNYKLRKEISFYSPDNLTPSEWELVKNILQ